MIIPGQVTGQVTKGQHMNLISLGLCNAFLWPIFHFNLNRVGYKNIRNGLGHFLVEVRSISGQKRSNLKVYILALNESMQLVTASLTVAFVFRYGV